MRLTRLQHRRRRRARARTRPTLLRRGARRALLRRDPRERRRRRRDEAPCANRSSKAPSVYRSAAGLRGPRFAALVLGPWCLWCGDRWRRGQVIRENALTLRRETQRFAVKLVEVPPPTCEARRRARLSRRRAGEAPSRSVPVVSHRRALRARRLSSECASARSGATLRAGPSLLRWLSSASSRSRIARHSSAVERGTIEAIKTPTIRTIMPVLIASTAGDDPSASATSGATRPSPRLVVRVHARRSREGR
jgi:hypothetical protein